jgi:hypothetical protein
MGRTHDVLISAFDLDRLESELDFERALADRLADALLSTLSSWMTSLDSEKAAQALSAWKEARSE